MYIWLIYVGAWQKPTQYYRAIILQLKINNFNYKKYITKQVRKYCELIKNENKSYQKLQAMAKTVLRGKLVINTYTVLKRKI